MGYVNASEIERAVKVLLPLLQADKSVRYSRFYDGTDACHAKLLSDLGLADDWISPELLVDLALDAMEEQGVVRRVYLDEELSDGEPDYRIDLVPGQPTQPIRVRGIDL